MITKPSAWTFRTLSHPGEFAPAGETEAA